MFERFDDSARQAVVQAVAEARSLEQDFVGTEHLLLGLLHAPGDPATALLVDAGLDLAAARAGVRRLLDPSQAPGAPGAWDGLDAAALDTIGIDLDAVRERVEAVFGAGALGAPAPATGARRHRLRAAVGARPFTGRAKEALQSALREAQRLGHRQIGAGHLLLGLLREGDDPGARVLRAHGLDPAALRHAVTGTLG